MVAWAADYYCHKLVYIPNTFKIGYGLLYRLAWIMVDARK